MPRLAPLLAEIRVGADEHPAAPVVQHHLVLVGARGAAESAQGWLNFWMVKGWSSKSRLRTSVWGGTA